MANAVMDNLPATTSEVVRVRHTVGGRETQDANGFIGGVGKIGRAFEAGAISRVLRSSVILISLLGVVSCGGTKTPSSSAPAYMGPSTKAVSVVRAHGFTEDPSGCYGHTKSSCRSFQYQTLTTIFLVQGGDLQVNLEANNLATEWALAGPVLDELYPAQVVQAADESLQNALNSGGKGVGGPNEDVADYDVSAGVMNQYSATVLIRPKKH